MKRGLNKNKPKSFLGKLWYLIWEDDSPKGWIFALIFLFIFVKLIFFPGLRLITGTTLPLAIVESCSMYHENNLAYNFNNWYSDHENKYSKYIINKLDFERFPLRNGFNKGDILFVVGVKPEKLKRGDVIIFNGGQANPIIHRIISIKENNGEFVFSTIGDNNNGQLSTEFAIKENQVVGKAVFKLVPYLGWGKLIFFELQRNPNERGLCDQN